MSPRAATSRLVANSPVELFHWAAVSFVIALIATVLSYAAGTAGLAEIATLCCYLFAGLGCALVVAGLRNLRDPRLGHSDTGRSASVDTRTAYTRSADAGERLPSTE
ncbi:MAG: hypothetical protein ACRYG5_08830 [Janthinobacterium lividum]